MPGATFRRTIELVCEFMPKRSVTYLVDASWQSRDFLSFVDSH